MRYVLLVIICVTLLGCTKVEEPQGLAEGEEKVPDREIWDGKIEITSDERKQSVVQAGHIESYEKEKITILSDGVIIDFYNKVGQHTSTLTSEQARMEEKTNLFVALGNVVVVSDSGEVLRTERLYWDRTERSILSDTLVILTTALDSVRGYDFKSNEDLTAWSLKNPTGQTFRRRQ